MLDHTLRVGEELVIGGHIGLTISAVEAGKVVFGNTAEPDGVQGPVIRQWRIRLVAVPASCEAPVTLSKETIHD